ncbi:uncharacterized protein LOC116106015 [Pistacia vera]|uniref:uncharacterized protein LOC116106015 n=1 Tax=Pistacia vera TaxID=55513 RepID=UPI00126359E1|nr:uncharacterized protein LOC116106015 [Pistacia vera]
MMAKGNSNPPTLPIPIFTGEKYDIWSTKMETYFFSQDLWDIVNEELSIPEITSFTPDWLRKQLKASWQKNAAALYILQQAVDDNICSKIYKVKTAKEAWNTLKEEFQGNTQPTILPDKERKEVEAECKKYLLLYKAILEGNLEAVRTLCDKDKDALKARITVNFDTALHVAVGTGKANHMSSIY